jgi:hypothetical protein
MRHTVKELIGGCRICRMGKFSDDELITLVGIMENYAESFESVLKGLYKPKTRRD